MSDPQTIYVEAQETQALIATLIEESYMPVVEGGDCIASLDRIMECAVRLGAAGGSGE